MVLIGRLTKDAVIAQLKDDRQVVNFTLAINNNYKLKGSDKWVTVTTYITCAYWLNPKVADRLKKGNLIEVTGRLAVSAYTDMQGEAKGALNCHVDTSKIHQQMKVDSVKTEPEKKEVPDDLPF
ncbi:MAG TPA: single-stranded DNA-binding protein [Chryseobacterium sp.]|nr:single-stranded DNA-binding protein [Chryseobacterium sp.]